MRCRSGRRRPGRLHDRQVGGLGRSGRGNDRQEAGDRLPHPLRGRDLALMAGPRRHHRGPQVGRQDDEGRQDSIAVGQAQRHARREQGRQRSGVRRGPGVLRQGSRPRRRGGGRQDHAQDRCHLPHKGGRQDRWRKCDQSRRAAGDQGRMRGRRGRVRVAGRPVGRHRHLPEGERHHHLLPVPSDQHRV